MTEFFNTLFERPDILIERFFEQLPKMFIAFWIIYGCFMICYHWLSLFKDMFTDLIKDMLALFRQHH